MSAKAFLRDLDYSVVQQCMHCGLCLPQCPTYQETKIERNSPRGRIAWMRAIADGELAVNQAFGEEMQFCLGCLACVSACPAAVDYGTLFETARSEIEQRKLLAEPSRNFWRRFLLSFVFLHPRRLRLMGRVLRAIQTSGLQNFARRCGFFRLLPKKIRNLESSAPQISPKFSDALIAEHETPKSPARNRSILIADQPARYRVGLLTGCVQDLAFAEINRDTADVLLANRCEVITPREQFCCGSLHSHTGELAAARNLARKNIDAFDIGALDAIITNSGGCGSHLKHYGNLLANDPQYVDRANAWDRKIKDIHEWLVEIGFEVPSNPAAEEKASAIVVATYHDSCHLRHGQKIFHQPRLLLQSIPGLKMVELVESDWCCGSAGIYNITQPEMAAKLQDRKIAHVKATGASIVATANPGCILQLVNGVRLAGLDLQIVHPITLLARAYRAAKS